MDSSILELDMCTDANRGFSLKSSRIANSVDPDMMTCYKPSHLDLHCFYRYLFGSATLKGLRLSMLGKNKQTTYWNVFIRPFEKRDVLCYWVWRPSVRKLFRFRLTPPTVYIRLS